MSKASHYKAISKCGAIGIHKLGFQLPIPPLFTRKELQMNYWGCSEWFKLARNRMNRVDSPLRLLDSFAFIVP